MKKKVALIDSSFICYRAYFALPRLSYKNKRSEIVYSFLGQVFTVAKTLQADQYLFFWDSKKSKRKEIFPEYKSKRNKREKTEEEKEEWKIVYSQFEQLRKRILPEMGFNNNFRQSGYESDDLLAKYVQAHGEAEDLTIVTSDDDLLQLLDYCRIFNLGKNLIVTGDDFIKKYGIQPKQWVEAKKLCGCKSDEIPGIKGVGESTAIKFLKGELNPESKAYKNITEADKEVILRNEVLVALPFKGTEDVVVRPDSFDMLGFLRLCRKYGMDSFRSEKRKEEIKQLFKGEVQNGKSKKRRKSSENAESSSEESPRKSSKSTKRAGFFV